MAKLGILEFLAAVGEDNILMQQLNPSISGITMNKRNDSKVTFLTDQIKPVDLMREPGKIGIVLWIETPKFRAAREAAIAKADADEAPAALAPTPGTEGGGKC